MHLQHAEARGLAKHPCPGGGVEFALALVHFERIRAIGTAERTAMGELGEQAERIVERLPATGAGVTVGSTVGGHSITIPAASCRRAPEAAWRHRPQRARAAPRRF